MDQLLLNVVAQIISYCNGSIVRRKLMNALIIFSYGNIQSLDDIDIFYNSLSHGHGTEEMFDRGYKLFRSIGTCDPLASTTKRIGRMLVSQLENQTQSKWKYYIGNKHTFPSIENAVQQAVQDGAREIFTLSLTPLYSKTGSRVYERVVAKALRHHEKEHLPLKHIRPYYNNESFINLLAERLQDAINWLPNEISDDAEIIFTSHSMPGNEKTQYDFIRQYEYLAKKIMEKVAINTYRLAYRSESPGPQSWLGPDILDVVQEVAKDGKKGVIVCEVLSIIANAEVIQEVSRDAQHLAHKLGMEFVQTEYLNDSADFVEVLTRHIMNEI